MLSSKQRSFLRGLANPLDPIFQIGKSGVSDSVVQAVDDALTARELIKIRVLKNATGDTATLANELAQATQADIVQIIGHNFILYRRNDETPVINLP